MRSQPRTEYAPLVLPAFLQPMPIASLHLKVAEVECRRSLVALIDRYESAAQQMRKGREATNG